MAESTDLGSMASQLRELAAAPIELLVRGTIVDEQYEIERAIGHGAMGVVYLARDMRLERPVAVKLARGQSAVALSRASREAVLLARLSHPNVVVIHQVGALDGRAYVAMEYVAGSTARAWCEDRTAGEIIELYIAVGEGLAAAHAAGLVHRDFKPENILVGEDGRGRVADFGLARDASTVDESIAGTPKYMAPEQVHGEDVDARADQYAFCVSLGEALKGKRPPRHVEAALRRGTASDRTARWPSLAPLLHELRRKPASPTKVVVLGLLAALVLVGPALYADTHRSHAVDPCAGGAQRIGELWPERYLRVRNAVDPPGAAPWVETATTAAVADLDRWTDRWAASDRAACMAAWSPTLHDRGVQCLARAKRDLAATIDALVQPGFDPTKLADVVAALPLPESCTDPLYLDAIVPPPTDPKLASEVAAAMQELESVPVLRTAGMLKLANAALDKVEHGPKLDWKPLTARIHHLRAMLEHVADDNAKSQTDLTEAYFEARASGERVLAAQDAAELAVLLVDMSKDADAAHWARLAEVEAGALADAQLEAQILTSLSVVASARGDAAHGLELADRAVRLNRSVAGVNTSTSALNARSEAYSALGKYELALADLDESDRVVDAKSGRSPTVSVIAQQRSLLFDRMGRPEDAIAAARKGLAIAEETAPGSDYVENSVGQLGVALSHAKQFPEALQMIDRSLAGNRKKDGETSYNVASDLNNRCDLLTQMGRYDEAIADGKAASAMFTVVAGTDTPDTAIAQFNLALVLLDAKRYVEARAEAAHGIAIGAKLPAGPTLGVTLIVHAESSWRSGHLAEAHADLDRAVAIFTADSPNPAWLPWAQLELAYVDKLENKQTIAKPLAVAARDAFRTLKDPHLGDAEDLVATLGGDK